MRYGSSLRSFETRDCLHRYDYPLIRTLLLNGQSGGPTGAPFRTLPTAVPVGWRKFCEDFASSRAALPDVAISRAPEGVLVSSNRKRRERSNLSSQPQVPQGSASPSGSTTAALSWCLGYSRQGPRNEARACTGSCRERRNTYLRREMQFGAW